MHRVLDVLNCQYVIEIKRCVQVSSSASAMLDPSSSPALLVQPSLSKAPFERPQEAECNEESSQPTLRNNKHVFSSLALQLWLLVACQDRSGLRDKPGKPADWYHSCYCLSGLSVAQEMSGIVLGGQQNGLPRTDPRLNVLPERLLSARRYFSDAAHSAQKAPS